MARSEGQIWIDKGAPYRLKYFVNGSEYTVEVVANYSPREGALIKKGTLVALDSYDNTIHPALFPDDMDSIVGIALESSEGSREIPVSTSGDVVVDKNDCFYNPFEVIIDEQRDINRLGAPVYWFIGRCESVEGEVLYYSPRDNAGKLTIGTPSGIKYGETISSDYKFNIGYDNLPQIGHVTNISGDTVTIHLNFSKMDSSLEWNWPYIDDSDSYDCGKIEGSTTLELYPGLYTSSTIRNICDITGKYSRNTSDEVSIVADVLNDYSKNKTSVVLKTPETLYIRISGRVNYRFDKGHR